MQLLDQRCILLVLWYFTSIERPAVSANSRESLAKPRLVVAQSECPATALGHCSWSKYDDSAVYGSFQIAVHLACCSFISYPSHW
jgi:hypothetical protein